MDTKKRIFSGVKWVSLSRILKQIFQFVTLGILAVILKPSDFGLIGLATLIIGFLLVIKDFGIGQALIQKKEINHGFSNSLFSFSFIFGFFLMLIVFSGAAILSSIIAKTNDESIKLTPILQTLSVGFFLTSISSIPKALLERNMAFNKLASIEIISSFISSSTSITLALLNFGVWSLVAQSIIYSIISSISLFFIGGRNLRFKFNLNDLKEIKKYITNLSGFGIVNYFLRNADYIIIGKFLGSAELGYYSLAYRLMLYPLQNVTNIISQVMFPVYSSLQSDHNVFKEYYIKVAKSISFLTFPILFGLFFLSPFYLTYFIGTKWEPVITLILLLSPVGIIQSITATTGSIYQAIGRTDLMFRWGLVMASVVISSFVIGIYWGINGVASGYLISNVLLSYFWLKIPFKLINLDVKLFIKQLRMNFLISFLSIAPTYLLNSFFLDENNYILMLFLNLLIISGLFISLNKRFNSMQLSIFKNLIFGNMKVA